MYEDFVATDRWTAEPQHCVWKGTLVAIATRHADATDIRFAVNGRPMWIAMPNLAWVEQKKPQRKSHHRLSRRTGRGTLPEASIESGYDNGRELYTMNVDEVLEHVERSSLEAGHTANLPSLPVINATRIRPSSTSSFLPSPPPLPAKSNAACLLLPPAAAS